MIRYWMAGFIFTYFLCINGFAAVLPRTKYSARIKALCAQLLSPRINIEDIGVNTDDHKIVAPTTLQNNTVSVDEMRSPKDIRSLLQAKSKREFMFILRGFIYGDTLLN